MNFESEEYLIKLPEKLSDIVDEGVELLHCVGGMHYLDRHIQKKSLILFVRKVETPDEPLYTVECQNGRIIQCRGYDNGRVPKEVHDFLDVWVDTFKNDLKHIGLP